VVHEDFSQKVVPKKNIIFFQVRARLKRDGKFALDRFFEAPDKLKMDLENFIYMEKKEKHESHQNAMNNNQSNMINGLLGSN